MKSRKNLLIIGSLPTPIGGVTIHMERSLAFFKNNGLIFDFLQLNKESAFKILYSTLKYRYIHLHTSNKLFRMLIAIYSKLFFKRLILTFHGRYDFANRKDKLALKWSYHSILLNQFSYSNAKQFSDKVSLGSAFIPPDKSTPLKDEWKLKILKLKSSSKFLFCTNAFKLVFMNEKELYGISMLVELFGTHQEHGIIISDPLGENERYVREKGIEFGPNILFIDENHDFTEVIKLSDCLIRATTSDGDSLSIKEALYFNKNVICSNVVERPPDCILFDIDDQNELLKKISDFKIEPIEHTPKNAATDLVKLYQKIVPNVLR